MTSSDRNQRIREIGSALMQAAREEETRIVRKHRWETALLDWCMRDRDLKTRVFRFIDVYPSLRSPSEVVRHIREYFPHTDHRLPAALRTGVALAAPSGLSRGPVRAVTEFLYRRVARLFIGASDEKEALERFHDYDRRGVRLSIDLLGEHTLSEMEADRYFERYLRLIEMLGGLDAGPERKNVSIKLSALDPRFDAVDQLGTSGRVRDRLRRLAEKAREKRVFLHIDMEDYSSRDVTLRIVRDLSEEEPFRRGVHLGVVLQAYLRDCHECCDQLLEWGSSLPVPLTVRLVRGAYWDTEVMLAQERHWPVPVFESKAETDRAFEALSARLIAASPGIRLAVATHNIRSIAFAMAEAEARGLARENVEFQILFGMGDSLLPGLEASGYPVRVYMPIGEPVKGMAYLVRRLLENVSSQSFVRRGIHEESRMDRLLAEPLVREGGLGDRNPAGAAASRPFFKQAVMRTFKHALERVPSGFPQRVPCVIGKKDISEGKTFFSVSPLDETIRVAQGIRTSPEQAEKAVDEAFKYVELWKDTPAAERAACLEKAADWLESRRDELASIEVYEAGKPWRQADADLVEAVDFLRFYAKSARELFLERATDRLVHETNITRFRPRGVTVVISPWNFPIAIPAGMTAAALAAGNPVILKPAEQTPLCGWFLFRALEEAGIPRGVIQFLPGFGEEIGPVLVGDSRTAVIAFTGSMEVGLAIQEQAQQRRPDQRLVKKVIAEMGGKNAAIVDISADFDQTIPAVLESAFGYAGQKCSALSRLIVLDGIYDDFTARLVEAAASYPAGNPLDPAVKCGPVIDKEAAARIDRMIEKGWAEGRLLFQGSLEDGLPPQYIPPTIFDCLPDDSALLEEEIFGPVLCVIRAADMQEALKIANHSRFALTGGVFSRTPTNIAEVRLRLEAGNLYINRPVTGAVVGRQPFGGFKLSGGGSKAGSPDYLREFCVEQTVTENLFRHGFAPLEGRSTEE